MRDLASRLRAIVHGGGRVLTYEPDGASASDVDAPARIAETLGGECCAAGCVVIDRVLTAEQWHGRRAVGSYVLNPASPLGVIDPRCAPAADWASRPVFFDIETTGLSGGAGTVAFLAGCGWFEGGDFRVRQFLLTSPAGEPALLDRLGALLRGASLLVTYNGRTFDVPFMAMRWAFHRQESPIDAVPHLDMLPPARRLWSRDDVPDRGCTLGALERSVLGFHRLADVPGFEIPARYYQFLRTGECRPLEGVLDHNRHDLISLAAVTSHALWLVAEGPDACRDGFEQFALGRLYERAGDGLRAVEAYQRAASAIEPEVRQHAHARLAVRFRRERRFDEAASAWSRVLAEGAHATRNARAWTALERQAAEALAIHHEHRVRDLAGARRYAETMREAGGHDVHAERSAADADYRIARLDRKMRRTGTNNKGGPEAARLLDDET